MLAARLSLAAGLLAWVFSRLDTTDLLATLGAAPGWLWPAVVAIFMVNTALYTGRVLVLLPEGAPFFPAYRAVLVANFLGVALPSGGSEAIKVFTLGRVLGGADRALAAVAVARLVEFFVWSGLVFWAAVAVLPGVVPALLPVAWAAGLGFMAAALLGLGVVPVPARALARLPGRLGRFAARSGGHFAELRARRGRLLASFALTLPFGALNCLVGWLVLTQLGATITYPQALGLIPTMDVLISLPVTVAGVGVRELAFVVATGPFGATPGAALAMAYTRWSGHLARAAIGGLLFVAGRRGR